MCILTVNGTHHRTENANHRTLLEVLRDDLGFKGAKLGCGEGECGACTVLVDGHAVCACLQLAATAAGHEVITIEAFATAPLGRRITQALAQAGAVQCGFCTPGIVMAAAGYFTGGRTNDTLEAALEGNLCRCTGYTKIHKALSRLPRHQARHTPLGKGNGPSLKDALTFLTRHANLTPIAGGTDLIVRHEHNLANQHFFDLTRVADEQMRTIQEVGGDISIGALVTWSNILTDQRILAHAPILAQVASVVGGAQIRNAATIGGNLVTASPAGDALPALSVLGATIVIANPHGRRALPLDQFLLGPGKTALTPGELVTSIRVPVAKHGAFQFFRKVGSRQAQMIAKVSLALTGDYVGYELRDLKIALGAVGPVPMTCRNTAELLMGGPLTRDLWLVAAQMLQREISPIDDHRSTRNYRIKVAPRLLFEAVEELRKHRAFRYTARKFPQPPS